MRTLERVTRHLDWVRRAGAEGRGGLVPPVATGFKYKGAAELIKSAAESAEGLLSL